MGEIVNLRRRRKQRARDEADGAAAANRAKFGQRKSDKDRRAAEDQHARHEIDGKKLTE